MVAANRSKKRLLELTQIVLAFIGTCGVLDATIPHGVERRPGFTASVPLPAATRDRRFNDLARTERKRREAQQNSSRRAVGHEIAVTRRDARA